MKTRDAVIIYRLIGQASVAKMDDADKLAMLRIMRAVKPICAEFDDARKDAFERSKPEGYDDRVRQHLPPTVEDAAFQRNLGEYVEELMEKEVAVSYERLPQKAVETFELSNGYSLEQMMLLEGYLVQEKK